MSRTVWQRDEGTGGRRHHWSSPRPSPTVAAAGGASGPVAWHGGACFGKGTTPDSRRSVLASRHRDEHGQQAPEGLVKWGRLDSHPLLARGGCTTVALVGSTPVIRSTKEHHRASTSPHPRCRSGQHAWPHGCRCQRGWSDSQLSQPDPDLLLPQWSVVAGPRTRNLGLWQQHHEDNIMN